MGPELGLGPWLGPPMVPRPRLGLQRLVEIGPPLGPPDHLHLGGAGPHCQVGRRPLVGCLLRLTRMHLYVRVGEGLHGKRAGPDRPPQQRTEATATSLEKQRH